jgi:hypothetical protein
MKPTVILLVVALSLVIAASSLGQGSSPDLAKRPGDITLVGRIVLYDWIQHETTSTDDFVVDITGTEGKEHLHYARVIYKPFWGWWDAPPAGPKDILDRLAFVGLGPTWAFRVHPPQTDQQKITCAEPVRNHRYEDENGAKMGEIPRFVGTPGAVVAQAPPVQSLPCFILSPGGLTRATKGRQAGAQR